MGYIAGNQKLKPIPEKVEAIENFSGPATKKHLMSFLGLVGFYRKFTPNCSAFASPLSDLTKKGQLNKVMRRESQHNAFLTLKSALMVTPVLKFPYIFILQIDASDEGIGAVAYASKKLTSSQTKYSTVENIVAIIWTV